MVVLRGFSVEMGGIIKMDKVWWKQYNRVRT